jgi:hypothetical protein
MSLSVDYFCLFLTYAVFAILSIFYIDKTGSTEKQFLGPNRKVVVDRAGK